MTGIYVHLPFCRVHCSYCPFAISTDIALQDAYVDALVREIGARSRGESVDSVYLGGGTPSRTSLPNLRRLLREVRSQFEISKDAEISIEANPEDVTEESIGAWLEEGVNRISIGVQSFDDGELRAIGRVHDAATAREAVRRAIASGVRTNLDLIAGLPLQTPESFASTLQTTIDLGAGHVSLYMLDLDETTPLQVQVSRGRTRVPDDDFVAAAYVDAIRRLADAGLQQYEISNFSREGEACRHNLRYWTRGDYYGFGLAAHSFAGERRFANTRNIRDYIASPDRSCTFLEELSIEEQRREAIFLGMRQTRGLDYARLVELGGQEGAAWVDRGLQDGWLARSDGRIAFTPEGFLLSNEHISQLF